VCLDWSVSGAINFFYRDPYEAVPAERRIGVEELDSAYPELHYVSAIRLKALELYRALIGTSTTFFQQIAGPKMGQLSYYFVKSFFNADPSFLRQWSDLYLQFMQNRAAGIQDPNVQGRVENTYKMVHTLATAHASAYNMEVLNRIRSWEQRAMNPNEAEKVNAELKALVYQQESSRDQLAALTQELQYFCARPDGIHVLRRRFKEKHPDMNDDQLSKMTRRDICRTIYPELSGDVKSIVEILPAVKFKDIRNVPTDLRIPGSHVLDVWTDEDRKKHSVNKWLIRQYGVTIEEVKEMNVLEDMPKTEEPAGEPVDPKIKGLLTTKAFLYSGSMCSKVSDDLKPTNICGGGGQNQDPLNAREILTLFLETVCADSQEIPMTQVDFKVLNELSAILETYGSIRKYISPTMAETVQGSYSTLTTRCVRLKQLHERLRMESELKESSFKDIINWSVKNTLRSYVEKLDVTLYNVRETSTTLKMKMETLNQLTFYVLVKYGILIEPNEL
jgi:hypothetical protein